MTSFVPDSSPRPTELGFLSWLLAWSSTSSSTPSARFGSLLVWYVLFGALHELAHVVTAFIMINGIPAPPLSPDEEYGVRTMGQWSWLWWWCRVLLFRQCSIQELFVHLPASSFLPSSQTESIIRHAGWMVSVAIVPMVWWIVRAVFASPSSRRTKGTCTTHDASPPDDHLNYDAAAILLGAAVWTAIEAIGTDLLQLPGLHLPLIPFVPISTQHAAASATALFCCGNFGIIVLHQAWLYDHGQSVLQVLDKMIQVTMMRGAQSGGVVVMLPNSDRKRPTTTTATGLQRVRVVNKKRTALHQELIHKIQRSVTFPTKKKTAPPPTTTERTSGGGGDGVEGGAALLAGHTRFATSSKATLDGTHPQQWTPKTIHHVLTNPNPTNPKHTTQPLPMFHFAWRPVENFVTHNGDFEFYTHQGRTYDLELIQQLLSNVTGVDTPSPVDSCAVAGMVDVLRTQYCFALSIRYVLCFAMSTSSTTLPLIATSPSSINTSTSSSDTSSFKFPTEQQLQELAGVFEQAFMDVQQANSAPNGGFSREQMQLPSQRETLAQAVVAKLSQTQATTLGQCSHPSVLDPFLDDEQGATLLAFCTSTIDAFWDHDLFWTMKTFMQNAKGSFGLTFITSMDAHRQVCLAARGQTMSIAFYPSKGLITYGSEQAAVKAGMTIDFPGLDDADDTLGRSRGEIDDDALRLDLDDLGGEIVLLDWGRRGRSSFSQGADGLGSDNDQGVIAQPHQPQVDHYDLMNGKVHVVIHSESNGSVHYTTLYHRMTRLTRNPFIKPLRDEPKDLILQDIQDIPKTCLAIQDEWHSNKTGTSLNRLSAFHLSRCLRQRLELHIKQMVPHNAVDILVTGCEVSLWVAEQFASDLKKALPRLNVQAVSSNKLLGLFGQDMMLPACGFPFSGRTLILDDAIVIIVSHSGGTFAPLACSSLLQSATRNLFVVTSEWDTQIGKQLRAMDTIADDGLDPRRRIIFNSRIFSTEIGMRSAEPCSLSVVATHQLLTNLLEYVCAFVLSDPRYRRVTGVLITEQDLQMLEKCNRTNIGALVDIVGVNEQGYSLDSRTDLTEPKLRAAGDLRADHILESARAYMLSFLYIFTTVISGCPAIYGLALLCGLDSSSKYMHLVRVLDAAIYFWLPQINITLLRVVQGRNLLHRMVGRTVVIGDIPWVAQCGEAFLSKIFAVSYSIAGLNVLSGNPADHLVHRHTHRVVRGTLLVCGRPDGRLSALSTAEAAVCLSVNQASSIQSRGGTCESITIGHNPFKLNLTANAIFLKRKRPLFLCERMLVEADASEERKKLSFAESDATQAKSSAQKTSWMRRIASSMVRLKGLDVLSMSQSGSYHDPSVRPRVYPKRSPAALLGSYSNIEESTHLEHDRDGINNDNDELFIESVVEEAIRERKFSDRARNLFTAFDLNGHGFLTEEEFIAGALKLKTGLREGELRAIFTVYKQHGNDSSRIDYHEFIQLMDETRLDYDLKLPPSNRDERGIIQIEASREKYFGENVRKYNAGKSKQEIDFKAARSQHFAQELYETRIASMQRFVAMVVMFHQMGKRVEQFFAFISFGWWGYRMDRTHSIMRIATTASPVSGSDVKKQMRQLQSIKKVQHSVYVISLAYLNYKARKENTRDAVAGLNKQGSID